MHSKYPARKHDFNTKTKLFVCCFGDSENLEEGSSLSRLISWLNPKLEGKKGKDYYYAFKYLFADIFTALIGEFFRTHLHSGPIRTHLHSGPGSFVASEAELPTERPGDQKL